jgi:hypothetical protein
MFRKQFRMKHIPVVLLKAACAALYVLASLSGHEYEPNGGSDEALDTIFGFDSREKSRRAIGQIPQDITV